MYHFCVFFCNTVNIGQRIAKTLKTRLICITMLSYKCNKFNRICINDCAVVNILFKIKWQGTVILKYEIWNFKE